MTRTKRWRRPRRIKVTCGHYTFGPYTIKLCAGHWRVFGGPVGLVEYLFPSLGTALLACRRELQQ